MDRFSSPEPAPETYDPGEEIVGGLRDVYVTLELVAAQQPHVDLQGVYDGLERVVAGVEGIVRRPRILDLEDEHRKCAIELVTAYLDRGERYELLAERLGAIDDQCRVDPGFRLNLLVALAQLTADALVAAVAVSADDTIDLGTVAASDIDAACRTLLGRIALTRL